MFKFIFGLAIGLVVAACASTSFPYVYYTYDYVNHKLLAKDISGDLDASACAPNALEKTPCAVIKYDELNTLIQDYEKMQVDLDGCQHPQPTGVTQ